MFYLNAVLLTIGGLVPLMIGFKLLKVPKHVYLLGWLSWVVGISIKAFISYLLTNTIPSLLDYWSFIIFATIIESTEVLSAYLFLRHHKGLKQVRDFKSLIAFGIGFGAGEAFSLAAATMLPVDLSLSMISLTVITERFSATIIHAATALLIGCFIINKKKINALLALTCKDLGALITVYAFPVLGGLLLETGVWLFELIVLAYSAFWLSIAYRQCLKLKVKGKKIKPLGFDINKVTMFSIVFLGVQILLSLIINPLTGLFIPTAITVTSIVSLVLLKYHKEFVNELFAGSFIGLIVFVISTFSGMPPELLELISIQSLIGLPSLTFNGVIIGYAAFKRLGKNITSA